MTPPPGARPDRPRRAVVPRAGTAVSAALGLAAVVLAGCSTAGTVAGGGAAATTVTVVRTVTVTAAAADDPSTEPGTSAPGSGTTDGLPVRADACDLLTLPEAQAVAGRRLQQPTRNGIEFGKATYCQFAGYPEDPGVGQVEVFVGDGVKKNLDIDKDNLKHPFTKVAGLGDEAWAEDGQIFFRKGSTWVTIAVVILDEDAEKPARLLAAAKLALGRMP